MVPEAPLEKTEHGLVPAGDGWFVLNARDCALVLRRRARRDSAIWKASRTSPSSGINVQVFEPGEAMAMYHWEADQEDFLVVAGEALLIIEGEERPLRQWDFVHCPPNAKHTIVGAGDGPCIVVAVGARQHQEGPDWGGYTVDETALRHEAGVEQETNVPDEAYAAIRAKYGARAADAVPRRLASLGDPRGDPGERLRGAAWCDVHLAPRLDELEALAERRGQLLRGIAPHRQARTHLRAVVGERRDDHASAGSECVAQRRAITIAVALVDEEVEDGAVVPQLVAAIRLPLEEIRSDAPHGRVGGKPPSGRVECRGRDVEHRDVGEAAGDELVGEERSPTADVDHGRLGRDPERRHQLERHGRSGLVPAHAVDPARGVGLVPVFSASHASI